MELFEPNITLRRNIEDIFEKMPKSRLQNTDLLNDMNFILNYFNDLPLSKNDNDDEKANDGMIHRVDRSIKAGARSIVGHILELKRLKHCHCPVNQCPVQNSHCSFTCPNNPCCDTYECYC